MMLLSREPKLNLSMTVSGTGRFCAMTMIYARMTSRDEKRDAPRPARRSGMNLDREAGHLEAKGRELFEVRELFHVAVTDLAPGLVTFPNEARVAGLSKTLARE